MRIGRLVAGGCFAVLLVACSAFGASVSAPPSETTDGGDETRDGDVPDALDIGLDAGSTACPYLRCVTFENGFDALGVTGAPTLTDTNPLKGLWSMVSVDKTQLVTVPFGSHDEVWVSFYVRMSQIPDSESIPFRLVKVASSPVTPVVIGRASGFAMYAEDDTAVQLGLFSTTLTPGSVYRIGVHTKHLLPNLLVEGYVASGDAAFGTPAFTASIPSTSAPDAVQMGSCDATKAFYAVFDDLMIAGTGLPAPSP